MAADACPACPACLHLRSLQVYLAVSGSGLHRPDALTGYHPDVLTGHRPDVLTGHRPEVFSGGRGACRSMSP